MPQKVREQRMFIECVEIANTSTKGNAQIDGLLIVKLAIHSPFCHRVAFNNIVKAYHQFRAS